MADETPRLGLPIYTSGTDLHPTREDFNDRMQLLEEAVAIARQGASGDRPMPSTRGTLFMETDTRILWFDTGTEWIRVLRVGNDGPGRALDIGGSGSEGSSEWAARADHVHPLPLASASQPGALSAADKALLNTASANATSNALARRNGSGQMSTAAPSAASHATNRGYVDGQVNSLMSRVDGMPQARERIRSGDLDNVTTVGAYSLWSGDISNVSNTPGGVSTSIVLDVVNPPDAFIVQYVHEVFAPARMYYRARTSSGWRPWTRVIESENDGHLLDMVDDASATQQNGTLIRRSPTTGRADIADPSSAANIANKRYVDGATSDIRDATVDDTPGTLVRRGSVNGTFWVADPRSGSSGARDAVNRRYVDDQISDAVEDLPHNRGWITSGNLNVYTTPGVYGIEYNRFGDVSNTPPTSSSVILKVTAGGSFVQQDATRISTGARFWRIQHSGGWSDWQQAATV